MKQENFIPVIATFEPGCHSVVQRYIRCGNKKCHLYDNDIDGCSITSPVGAIDMYAERSIVCFNMQLWVETVLENDPNAQAYLKYKESRIDDYFKMVTKFIDYKLKENAKMKEEIYNDRSTE